MGLFIYVYVIRLAKLESGEYSGFDEWQSLPSDDRDSRNFFTNAGLVNFDIVYDYILYIHTVCDI